MLSLLQRVKQNEDNYNMKSVNEYDILPIASGASFLIEPKIKPYL